MLCKYEGGDYISYDQVVAEGKLAEVVGIQFSGLKKYKFQTTVSKVNWKLMPNVKKIEGVRTDFTNYSFPKGALPQLEEVVFTSSDLSAGTLKSLLDAVPNVDTDGTFKFTWDSFSSLGMMSYEDDEDDEEELKFEIEQQRVKEIQAKRKEHDLHSGSTVIPPYDEAGSDISDDYMADLGDVPEDLEDIEAEIFIEYSTDNGARFTIMRSTYFEKMSEEDRAQITHIKIDDAEGLPLLSAMNFEQCTQLTSLSISNACLDGTGLIAPDLPNLTSLTLTSCGVNVEGVGYFLNNGTNRPIIKLIGIAKENGDIFEQIEDDEGDFLDEFSEFKGNLQKKHRYVTFQTITASETPFVDMEDFPDDSTEYSESTEVSDPERMEARVISSPAKRSRPTLNSQLLDAKFRSGLDADKATRLGMSDDSSSERSIHITRLSAKPTIARSMSASTFSEMDAIIGRGKTVLGDRVEIEDPWEPGEDTPERFLEEDIELVPVEPIILCRLADGRTGHYRDLTDIQRQQIVAMDIRGRGPNTNALVLLPQERWNELTQLKTLSISGSSISIKYLTSKAPEVNLPSLTEVTIGNCGVDFAGLNCLVGGSPSLRTFQHQGIQKAKGFSDGYRWESFLPNDAELARIKERFQLVEQSIDEEEILSDIGDFVPRSGENLEDFLNDDTPLPHRRSAIDDLGLSGKRPSRRSIGMSTSLWEPYDLGDRLPSAASVVSISFTYRRTSMSNVSLSHEMTLDELNSLTASERKNIETMTITGNGPGGPDVVSAIKWSNLSGLRTLDFSGVTVEEPLDLDEIEFENLQSIRFRDCGVDAGAFRSFYSASTEGSLKEMTATDLKGLRLDGSWSDLKESEKTLIRKTLESANIYELAFDSSIRPQELSEEDIEPLLDDPEVFYRLKGDESEEDWKAYSSISDEDWGNISEIEISGTGPQTNLLTMPGMPWEAMTGLETLIISNASIAGGVSTSQLSLIPSLKTLVVGENCGVDYSGLQRFVYSKNLTTLTLADNVQKAISNEDGIDFEEFTEKERNKIAGLRAIVTGREFLREAEDAENIKKTTRSVNSSLISAADELEDDVDEELSGPLFPTARVDRHPPPMSMPKILCYYSEEEDPITYSSELNSSFLQYITRIEYEGRGPQDNAMEIVPWAKLTGLESLSISNASVSGATSFRGQVGKTLFPQLTKMYFYGCKLGPKAIEGFVTHASSKLQTFDTLNCDSEFAQDARKIEVLKAEVNQRSKAFAPPSMPSHDRPNRGSATERRNSLHQDHPRMGFSDPGSSINRHNKASRTQQDRGTGYTGAAVDKGRQGMYSDGSNRSESSTPRNSSRTTIRSEDGAHNRTQPASRGPMSTGAAAGAATNRPSLFTPPPAQHRTTSAGNLGSVHTAGDTAGSVQNRYKSFSREPELVVDNESENSRNYKKLVDDTAAALGLIKQETSFDGNNYRFSTNEDEQTTSITYQQRDRMVTPILDAGIDTVKVHRGWGQVDRTISHETRAQIVLASLGIPPCPPDIAISNERSGLGRAIRAEFNKLKLRPDEPEITVTIKPR